MLKKVTATRAGPAGAGRYSSLAVNLTGQGDSVQLLWKDGASASVASTWLRERCQSDLSVHAKTKQPLLNPHDLPDTLLVQEAALDTLAGQLNIQFNDGHISQLPLQSLIWELESFRDAPIQVQEYDRPEVHVWSGESFTKPEVFQHDQVVRDETVRLEVIKALLTSGVALVRGVPQEAGEVVRFGQRLSTLRSTDWGDCFNVRTKPDTDSKVDGGPKLDLAYTPRPIGFHTDNPYRTPTPDFQLLHAIEHCSCPEGEAPCAGCSVMNFKVDGLYIAELLKQEDPEGFRLMCEVPVRFENDGGDGGSALVNVAPHFDLDESGHITAIRFSAKSGQYLSPMVDVATQKAFYKARRRFSELLHDNRYSMKLQFTPGDLVVFDNQRILHARSEIQPSDGERWVQGCYINRDGLWLNYERWRRRVAEASAAMRP